MRRCFERVTQLSIVLLLACVAGQEAVSLGASLDLRDRLVFCNFNLAVDANVDTLERIFRRAAKAGYTGVVISDTKYGRLAEMPPNYFSNIDRLKKLAAECKLEIIPKIFPIGYSEALLWNDPNLAEGLPVRDALFVVKNGGARLVADLPVSLPDDLSKWDWRDKNVVIEGTAAHVTNPNGENARIVRKLKVKPFRQYHISARIKTQGFQGSPEIKVLAGNKSLTFADLGVKPTQDWTLHHVVFNSLENDEVAVYLGCWDGTTGSLWWRDARIEEVGLLNVVRRDGAPLVVKREDGTVLAEGKDFETVTDPRMGNVPWKGAYEVWHEPPPIRTKLPDGTRLRVSYYHATIIHADQVMICPSEPKTVELLRDMAKRMHAAWGAKSYFMSHDEIRVLNQDESCTRRKLDAGAIVADNVRTCIRILHDVNPGGRIFVWSDMFDPNHNAHKDYYLVRGDLTGAWEGLDKDVIIGAWYYEKRDASLKWFSKLGNPILVAGYYDSKPERIRGWLDAARKVKGVEGVMYTTWQHKYDDLERFAEIADAKWEKE